MTKIDNNLANLAVALHATLEQTQVMIDQFKGTNLYNHKLKKDCNAFSKELDYSINKWYKNHLSAPNKLVSEWADEDHKRAAFIKTYQDVCIDLENAIQSLLTSPPATWKLIPHFLEALQNDQVQII